MDDETIDRKAREHDEQEQQKLDKKYEKMCAKAQEEGNPKPPKPSLEKRELTLDRCEKQFASLCARIEQSKTMRVDKVCAG